MFGATFGIDLGKERFFNVNEMRRGDYQIAPDIKKAIEKYRAADIELYRRAVEIFSKQSAAIAV